MKWYGSIENRLMEQMEQPTLEVGMGVTETMWSDRHAYEITKIVDQKHIYIRRVKAIRTDDYGMSDSQDYRYESDENAEEHYITKRGKYWYWTNIITKEYIEEALENYKDEPWRVDLFLIHNNTNVEEVMKKGKVTRLRRTSFVFGKMDEYYDYSF